MSQRAIVASWAEEVPGAPQPMTLDDLLAQPEDAQWQYELVEGRLVRMPASGGEASAIAARLLIALGIFVEPRGLGTLTGADGEYDLTVLSTAGETALAPDLAFVRAERVPARDSAEYQRAWRVAPDLVVEVVSPNQRRPEMFAKAQRYLAAGVRLMWLVRPTYRQVDVLATGNASAHPDAGFRRAPRWPRCLAGVHLSAGAPLCLIGSQPVPQGQSPVQWLPASEIPSV